MERAQIPGATLRQRGTLREREHRPWTLPDRPWLMAQTWERLLFAHWAVPAELLRPVVPPQLPIDVRDGSAWIGVTPFRVRALRLRLTPPAPFVSRFPELNVRTYVTIGGRPGIYFFSLDAARRAAVVAARRSYRLPYFHARARMSVRGEAVEYRSVRRDGPPADLDCSYRPVGPGFKARPGSLEQFLTERYCLYTLDEEGTVLRGEVHHPPWQVRHAEAEFRRNTMTAQLGFELEGDPVLHVAERQDVLLWKIRPADADA